MPSQMKLTANEKYTVFDRVRFEQLNWTGYNADLLDNLVDVGNELIKENEKLRVEHKSRVILPILQLLSDRDTWRSLASIALLIGIVGWVCVGFGYLFKWEGASTDTPVGYRLGQIDVISGNNIAYERGPMGYVLKEDQKDHDGFSSSTERLDTHYKIKVDGTTYEFFLED